MPPPPLPPPPDTTAVEQIPQAVERVAESPPVAAAASADQEPLAQPRSRSSTAAWWPRRRSQRFLTLVERFENQQVDDASYTPGKRPRPAKHALVRQSDRLTEQWVDEHPSTLIDVGMCRPPSTTPPPPSPPPPPPEDDPASPPRSPSAITRTHGDLVDSDDSIDDIMSNSTSLFTLFERRLMEASASTRKFEPSPSSASSSASTSPLGARRLSPATTLPRRSNDAPSSSPPTGLFRRSRTMIWPRGKAAAPGASSASSASSPPISPFATSDPRLARANSTANLSRIRSMLALRRPKSDLSSPASRTKQDLSRPASSPAMLKLRSADASDALTRTASFSARRESAAAKAKEHRGGSPLALRVSTSKDSGFYTASFQSQAGLTPIAATSADTTATIPTPTTLLDDVDAFSPPTPSATPMPPASEPSTPGTPIDEPQLLEEMGDHCQRIVVAASEEMLVTLLVNPTIDQTYPGYTRDFLLTYRHFMADEKLWEMLIGQFEKWSAVASEQGHSHSRNSVTEDRLGRPWLLSEDESLPILLRITNAIHLWLQDYSYLFHQTTDTSALSAQVELRERVSEFVSTTLMHHPQKHVRISAGPMLQVLKCQAQAREPAISEPADPVPSPAPTGIIRRRTTTTNPNRTKASLIQLKPDALFRQLTLIELEYFRAVRPLDLYLKSVGKLDHAPNLSRLIERFNFVSYWVATEICMCRDVKRRASVIKLFIKVARLCFEWHNYSTCLQIIAALSMTCVRRLKKTWRLLPRKWESEYRNLSQIFSASKNYSNYRHDVLAKLDAASHEESVPASSSAFVVGGIPFMGVHLSDLVLIEEGYGRDHLSNGMVNFKKMSNIAKSYRQFVDLQRITKYPFDSDSYTQRFLTNDVFALPEDKLWKASRICEPDAMFDVTPDVKKTLLSSDVVATNSGAGLRPKGEMVAVVPEHEEPQSPTDRTDTQSVLSAETIASSVYHGADTALGNRRSIGTQTDHRWLEVIPTKTTAAAAPHVARHRSVSVL